jgi:LysM repeat protein
MMANNHKFVALGLLLLSVFLVVGCTRDAATDPLAATTTASQSAASSGTATPAEFPTPQPTAIVIASTPVPTTSQPAQAEQATSVPATSTPSPTVSAPQPTSTTAPTAAPGTGTTYTVKSGDRLFSIGRQFGVNPYSIAQANNILPPYIIYPGQTLKIPSGSGTTVTPAPGGRTHVVARGENLFRISLRYGTTVQALAAANNIANVNLVYAGQVLRIP